MEPDPASCLPVILFLLRIASFRAMATPMRRALGFALLAAISGGRESTKPAVPTSVAFAPQRMTFSAVGASDTVVGTVLDQRGKPILNVPLTWSVEGSAATITPIGPDSALVTSVMNGTALVRASVEGGASG